MTKKQRKHLHNVCGGTMGISSIGHMVMCVLNLQSGFWMWAIGCFILSMIFACWSAFELLYDEEFLNETND
jgi:hypothetical protein